MNGESYALFLLSMAKWSTSVALLWLIGVIGYRVLVGHGIAESREPGGTDRRLVVHAGLATGLLVLASAARLYAQTYSAFGLDEPVTGALLRLVAEQTRWGARWQIQVGAAVVAMVTTVLVWLRWRGAWFLLGAVGLVVVGSAPLTGHAWAYAGGRLWPWSLQLVHLLAAGVWLGSLFVLLVDGLQAMSRERRDRKARVVRLVDRFSPAALTAAAIVGGTGALTALLYVDEWSQLWQTLYGRVLLVKMGLFGLIMMLGAYNWKFVKPRLADADGGERLRYSGGAELAVAVVLLAVTAWLVHLPMPQDGMAH